MKKIIKSPIYILKNELINYPTSINLNYNWSFGSLSGLFLAIQLITGIILAIHYIADVEVAFENIEHIMRDVNYGWFVRYLHANSASFLFICMYLHIFRGIYYKSYLYPRNVAWNVGVIILLLSIITAFIGYVLPWGQMSYRGATVKTNLVTAIPLVGNKMVIWIWGGYTVTGITLIRFFNFHYLLAIILTIVVILHMYLVHESGSSNNLMIKNSKDYVNFYRNYFLKDSFIFFIFVFALLFVVCFYPNVLGHTDNYIKANPFITPTHIVPEWYFLPFYAILRSIDNKLLGVISMVLSILILFILPFIKPLIKNSDFKIIFRFNFFFWSFLIIVINLWFIGGLPVSFPYNVIGKLFTYGYFSCFIVEFLFTYIENKVIIRIINQINIRSS
jgi:quinol-cytochrome oxidoreductase complex cytochrome b subunit